MKRINITAALILGCFFLTKIDNCQAQRPPSVESGQTVLLKFEGNINSVSGPSVESTNKNISFVKGIEGKDNI